MTVLLVYCLLTWCLCWLCHGVTEKFAVDQLKRMSMFDRLRTLQTIAPDVGEGATDCFQNKLNEATGKDEVNGPMPILFREMWRQMMDMSDSQFTSYVTSLEPCFLQMEGSPARSRKRIPGVGSSDGGSHKKHRRNGPQWFHSK